MFETFKKCIYLIIFKNFLKNYFTQFTFQYPNNCFVRYFVMFFTENVALRCIFRNLLSITGMPCDNVMERHVISLQWSKHVINFSDQPAKHQFEKYGIYIYLMLLSYSKNYMLFNLSI